MDSKEYIASGILELYVAGVLSEKENEEVARMLEVHPELQEEVIEIENAIQKLTGSVNPGHTVSFQKVRGRLADDSKVIKIDTQKNRPNWFAYTGWAASVLFAMGMLFTYLQNNGLQRQLEDVTSKNGMLEQQIADARNDAEKQKQVVAILRERDMISVPLGGQQVAPDAYAKVYWNKKENIAYIDAFGLPEPPEGMVYQVWSLTLDPLTPTSIGLLNDFAQNEIRVFALENANPSQAFGITLEPAGGSETPTMEQLYTLGVVTAS